MFLSFFIVYELLNAGSIMPNFELICLFVVRRICNINSMTNFLLSLSEFSNFNWVATELQLTAGIRFLEDNQWLWKTNIVLE